MFLRLEIPVHNIKLGPPRVPENSPDHDFYILPICISLNHLFLPSLGRSPKALLLSFTLPLLYRTLITLYI
jgi:hypothetical protein